MYVKPVVLTAFVSPEVRQQIKILAVQKGVTVRELIATELQRLIDATAKTTEPTEKKTL